jgi:hypothetical protein
VVRLLLLASTVACRFDLDGVDRPSDSSAPDGVVPACSEYGPFSALRSLAFNASTEDEYGATLSPDGKLLVYNVARPSNLFFARWDEDLSDFVGTTPIAEANTVAWETDAAFSSDGTVLYFLRDGTMRTMPVASGPDFGNPVSPTDLVGLPAGLTRPRFTADGLEVVFWRNDVQKVVEHGIRTAIGGPWTLRAETAVELAVDGKDNRSPTITGDGLTVFFAVNDFEIYSSTRPDRESGFATPALVDLNVGGETLYEPEISVDGRTLIVTRVETSPLTENLHIATRECLQ